MRDSSKATLEHRHGKIKGVTDTNDELQISP